VTKWKCGTGQKSCLFSAIDRYAIGSVDAFHPYRTLISGILVLVAAAFFRPLESNLFFIVFRTA